MDNDITACRGIRQMVVEGEDHLKASATAEDAHVFERGVGLLPGGLPRWPQQWLLECRIPIVLHDDSWTSGV